MARSIGSWTTPLLLVDPTIGGRLLGLFCPQIGQVGPASLGIFLPFLVGRELFRHFVLRRCGPVALQVPDI